MEVETEANPVKEETNENLEHVGGRAKYTADDNIVIEDIIANFEGTIHII